MSLPGSVRNRRGHDKRLPWQPPLPGLLLCAWGEVVGLQSNPGKKGVSPKLTSQWVGPACEVLELLSNVVYRVKMCVCGRVVVLH